MTPKITTSHLNISTVHGKLGDLEKALFHFLKAQEVYVAVHGHDHPSVADSKYNMALLHKRRNETERARQLFLECEQIYAKVYGPDHSETKDAAQQASRCL